MMDMNIHDVKKVSISDIHFLAGEENSDNCTRDIEVETEDGSSFELTLFGKESDLKLSIVEERKI